MRTNNPPSLAGVYHSPVPLFPALMSLAELWAESRSKDPRTAVGAIVYHEPTGAMYFGYNGFPVGVPDTVEWWDDRAVKHSLVAHAETNAIRRAHCGLGEDLSACIMVVSKLPCCHCLRAHIAPSRLRKVYYKPDSDDVRDYTLEERLNVELHPLI